MTQDRRVHFIRDFDYKPKPSVTIAYRKGEKVLVRLECAEQAIARGYAVSVKGPVPKAGIADRIASKVKKNG